MDSEVVLELKNIFHSGQVEPSSLTQRLFGNVETGLILKDINLEIRQGEVYAILGSKGSGKRALLDVISRRAPGVTRGQILFERSPLTLNVFQKFCSYVSHRCDLLPSLDVEQTLYYAARLTGVSGYVCKTRARQMMSDLALNQVSKHSVDSLNPGQLRRLVIGVQLIKEPILLLLDEPTRDLDPLSTYLIISILSSYARRRGRAVLLTMEKPRSDVFPFLDKASFLCLGDVLYAGPTRLMLDYFNSIGFPCPVTENPLMYYLCLSTVDRRSRERFLESHAQIIELVEKFKSVGHMYSGGNIPVQPIITKRRDLRYEKPSRFHIFMTLIMRFWSATFNITLFGLSHILLRLTLFPIYSLIVFLLYFNSQNDQHLTVNRYGLLFFSFFGAYITSIFTTSRAFHFFRIRYYQEAQDGLYGGPLFVISYTLFSLPFGLISTAAASKILFQASGLTDFYDWIDFFLLLWSAYFLAEQQTISLMSVVRSRTAALISSSTLCLLYLVLSSGILRSYAGMSDWLLFTSYSLQPSHSVSFLSSTFFPHPPSCADSPSHNCRPVENLALAAPSNGLATSIGLGLTAGFASAFIYVLPLPGFLKAKFRD